MRIHRFSALLGCCLLTGLHHSYRAGLHIKPLVLTVTTLYLNPKRGNKTKRGNKRGNKTMFCCCSQRGIQILSYRPQRAYSVIYVRSVTSEPQLTCRAYLYVVCFRMCYVRFHTD